MAQIHDTQQTRTTMQFLSKHQSYLFIVPVFFIVASIIALMVWGLKPGIDLAGGSALQVRFENRPPVSVVESALRVLSYGEIRVQSSNENEYLLRQRELSIEEKSALMSRLETLGSVAEVQFTSVGPSIGSEIVRKAWWAFAMVSLSIILFIAFVLRHVSKPVASWKYGVVAIVTLAHDILIPTGLFAYLGYARGAEVGVFFIVAILATLGISINDTIVVFDRIRENLRINEEKKQKQTFGDVVWASVMQTLARSFNTSLTVIIMLAALFVYGPDATQDFSLTLIVGMIAGTYSSIFLASPLLVVWERYQKKV